ncbi:MAG TPA: HAD family hydrolase [Pyrinomonadaceae bacterium]|jgi:phosphoglycolate phosphatase-like HAD superfamily hydrolase
MRLAIFDIDGTLTETNDVDSVCFVQAMADAHAVVGMNTNWGEYAHTTDSFITREVLRGRYGRAPDAGELTSFQSRFVGLLEDYRSKDATLFAEIGGAAEALARLGREPGWAWAVASGCWRGSGELKLRAAGLETGGAPAAFAEDGLSREEILLAAVARAREFYGCENFERVVSLGDGLWDVRAAQNLGFAFVGVGSGERAAELRQAGASHVVEDFTDYERLIRCLSESEVPGAGAGNPEPAHGR